MKNGILILKKPAGMTSHDAVFRIRKLYGTRKVGHNGTLDPQAEGVLLMLIGSAVKACDLIPSEEKVYLATLRFGLETDTEDIWGKVLKTDPSRPEMEAFFRAAESFVGEYSQIPPMVSAVKIGGKKLYEYAREGIVVERKPRLVHVHRLEVLSWNGEEATIRVSVSKGTYIRTLITDLCRKVGCLGVMTSLVREKSGIFSLEQAVDFSSLEKMTQEEREELLFPTEQVFFSYPVFPLPDFFDGLIANGCAVLIRKLNLKASPGDCFRLYRDGSFFALGEIVEDEEGLKLRTKKQFPN